MCPVRHCDPACLELAAQLVPDVGVLQRDQAREHLDQGHLGAAAPIERGELDADGAGAEHDGGGRRPVELERLVAGEHDPSVRRDAGQLLRPRAGREDHGARLDIDGIAVCGRDRQPPRALEAATSVDHCHLVLAQQELDALVELRDHLVAAPSGDRVVEPHVRRGDAEGVGVAKLIEQRRALEERLRGDAPAMQARAPDLVLFDEHRPQTELRRPDRRGIAPHPATEDGDVETLGHSREYIGGVRPFRIRVGCACPRACRGLRQVGARVDPVAVVIDAEVEVAAGGVPGRPLVADQLPARDGLPAADGEGARGVRTASASRCRAR